MKRALPLALLLLAACPRWPPDPDVAPAVSYSWGQGDLTPRSLRPMQLEGCSRAGALWICTGGTGESAENPKVTVEFEFTGSPKGKERMALGTDFELKKLRVDPITVTSAKTTAAESEGPWHGDMRLERARDTQAWAGGAAISNALTLRFNTTIRLPE